MSKARDWPGGWQMPGVGGDWAQVELTDALGSGFFFFFFVRSKLCYLL